MDEPQCKNCHYYIRHYGFNERRIFQVYCGHCTFSQVRKKRPDTPACPNFASGTNPADAFVTKEYLSKKLLEYVLSLDMLPEIEEISDSP